MLKFYLPFLLLFYTTYGQKLHHQMISAQGTSKVVPNGIFVSQSIGQQTVIGNYTNDGKTYGQGFQQSIWSKYISSNAGTTIITTTYPNPFTNIIHFQFSQSIKDIITISIFDIRGRLVHSEDQKATDKIVTLELPNLASSNYLVRLTTPNYTYYTQILKQE